MLNRCRQPLKSRLELHGRASMEKPELLIVDDEVNTLIVFKSFLEDNYCVQTAENAGDALEIFEKDKIDLVIADQRMPGMSGVDMLCRMKELNPDCIRIILTAYADFSAVLQAVNEGDVYKFVLKPWNLDEMSSTIKQALEHLESIRARERLLMELYEKNKELKKTAEELASAQDALINTEKIAVVGKLAGSLVHEISNHMTTIYFVDRIAQKYKNDEELQAFTDSIKNLNATVSGMLEVYRHYASSGILHLRKRACDLNEVVNEAVSIACNTSAAKGRLITFEPVSKVEAQVDKQKVMQVLINLIKNAAFATSEQNGRVELSIEDRNEGAVIRVSDNGSGIPADVQERIWEPFFSTKGDSGLGLGLEICKTFIEGHGGIIDFISSPDEGTTFSIFFPKETEY